MRRTHRRGILGVALVLLVVAQITGPGAALGADNTPTLGAEEREQLERGLREATARLETLRRREGRESTGASDRRADAEVFAKGIAWALKYDTTFTPADQKLLSRALGRGRARVAALEAGHAPWAYKRGKVVRGFVSAVDRSVQPYALVVPANYDRSRPMRLDVVLHGSTRPVGMSELRFLGRFDEPDEAASDLPARDYIELHPLGRVENGYRWAGETDVFEAVAAACRNYAIDPDRIVLRGMSMGASGTWHLGLKHPDRFVALGPYCGYVDTHEFSKTPLPNFVPVGSLPAHQEKTLHMLDSVDYAANAAMVPAIACMGEKDVFFQAHEIMSRAMAREGLAMVNLISPGTGHVLDPATHGEQMRRISTIVAHGKDRAPAHIRFVTWTLKYSGCAWLQILGLEEHYRRAEVEAWVADDGSIKIAEATNVTRLALLPPVTQAGALRVSIGGLAVTVPARQGGADKRAIVIGKRDGAWAYLGERDELRLDGKQPGQQGPIDDAFTAPFLCVRGTGVAWSRAVQSWSDACLNRFAAEWSRYFRAALPVKDDTAVTDEDVERCNLILFGDPGSNFWIRRVLPQLPIRWTPAECSIGKLTAASVDHAPVLIQPSPHARGRYAVLNSGHTFHEAELATLNYLLFPRLGDWAVVKVAAHAPEDGLPPGGEEVLGSGFFDERWGVGESDTGPGEPGKQPGSSAPGLSPRP
jgi:pimeloyl-ACP methyl ester carboxylesterase